MPRFVNKLVVLKRCTVTRLDAKETSRQYENHLSGKIRSPSMGSW